MGGGEQLLEFGPKAWLKAYPALPSLASILYYSYCFIFMILNSLFIITLIILQKYFKSTYFFVQDRAVQVYEKFSLTVFGTKFEMTFW